MILSAGEGARDHDGDPGDHDGDPGDHDAAIRVITIARKAQLARSAA
jgi:hypothetical protein